MAKSSISGIDNNIVTQQEGQIVIENIVDPLSRQVEYNTDLDTNNDGTLEILEAVNSLVDKYDDPLEGGFF